MITNKGKDIIVKYMLGQTPSYASYIALGCGPKTLAIDPEQAPFDTDSYKIKTGLDFEMFRIPVTSKGYIQEDGFSKIILTGQLPTTERYQITEVGIFSAGADSLPGANNSKMLLSFAENESWTYFSITENTLNSVSRRQGAELSDIDNNLLFNNSSGAFPPSAWYINSDDVLFLNTYRSRRNEVPRYLNNSIMLAGNISTFNTTTNPAALVPTGGSFVQRSGISLDLVKNSPNDKLKIAYSIVDKKGYSQSNIEAGLPVPSSAKILVEFSDGTVNGEYKRFGIINNSIDASNDFTGDGRYYVASISLDDQANTVETSGFSWSSVNTVKIYTNVSETTTPSASEGTNFFVAIDGIRIETESVNPLYGLTGYTVVRNADSSGYPVPVDKKANSSNFIEFRFAVDVV